MTKNDSLTDDLGIATNSDPVASKRIEIGTPTAPRRPIDADWSKKKKSAVTGATVGIAALALALGTWFFIQSRPPSMPETVEDVVRVIETGKFSKLDEGRQRSYATEAARLMSEMPREEARALWENEENREALRDMMRVSFDENIREWAKTGEMQNPFGRRPRNNDGDNDENNRPRPPRDENGEEMTPEQRMEAMRERIANAVREQIGSGNAQSGGLQGEFWGSRSRRGGR